MVEVVVEERVGGEGMGEGVVIMGIKVGLLEKNNIVFVCECFEVLFEIVVACFAMDSVIVR